MTRANERETILTSAGRYSRTVLVLAISAAIAAPIGALLTALNFPRVGLAMILVAFLVMVIAIAVASFALFKVRCANCDKRFFSLTYPVWPFEWKCRACGASARGN